MELMERQRTRPVKPPPDLTPAQVDQIAKGVQTAVALLMRRRVPISQEDATQEAWVAGLEATANWRADGGASLASYVTRAAMPAVRLRALRDSCPVTAGKGTLRRAQEASDPMLSPVQPDHFAGTWSRAMKDAGVTAPRGGEDEDPAGERTAWVRRRLAFKRALARLPMRERAVAEMLVSRAWLGLPVDDPGALVEAEGLGTRQDAARALRLFREAVLDDRAACAEARLMILGEE